MVEADEEARAARHIIAVDQVGGEDADEDKELLAGEAHDGQRNLNQRYELAVFPPPHPCHLCPMLLQLPVWQCATKAYYHCRCVANLHCK